MNANEMKDLILNRIPPYLVSHQQLWRLCGSPQHPDNALFDEVLLTLFRNKEVLTSIIYDEDDIMQNYPLRGYAGK